MHFHKNILNKNKKITIHTSISEPLDNLGDGGSLLTDGDVDAVQLLLLILSVVETLLVDDGINGNGGLTSLPVIVLIVSVLTNILLSKCLQVIA